jgi:hypothetical protein
MIILRFFKLGTMDHQLYYKHLNPKVLRQDILYHQTISKIKYKEMTYKAVKEGPSIKHVESL